jgi:hypothetical protein
VGTKTSIPAATFTAAVRELDATALAAFVADLRAETADRTTVDPPWVTVRTDGVRTDLLVAPEGADPADRADADTVVTTTEKATGSDVLTAKDLRRRLLYGLDPEAADALCERHLGVPARSDTYVDTAAEQASTESGGDGDQGENDPEDRGKHDRSGHERVWDGRPDGPDDGDGPGTPTGAAASTTTVAIAGRRAAVVAAVAALALVAVAVGSGALPVGSLVDEGAPSTGADDGMDGVTETPSSPATASGSDSSVDRPVGLNGTGNRNVGLEPTCTRSPLLVVQIQMNALKHNDNATNDGIRTVRRFASPRNRRSISFERLVSVVKSSAYAPMLSYDSVRYTPDVVEDRTTTVRVTTYVERNATGRYAFFLSEQRDNTYDGCWMTDGVQALTLNRTA